MGGKAHPDVNDTLRQNGPDAVRERHDRAHKKKAVALLLEQTIGVFERWLLLSDNTPILAVLGAVAANYLPGDPVWLGLIAPPSSAKTEILNSTSLLPHVFQAATLTPAGLLSGTPKKMRSLSAKGGLLQQIGDFGIIARKDFGSLLSMRPDAKAEILAALGRSRAHGQDDRCVRRFLQRQRPAQRT